MWVNWLGCRSKWVRLDISVNADFQSSVPKKQVTDYTRRDTGGDIWCTFGRPRCHSFIQLPMLFFVDKPIIRIRVFLLSSKHSIYLGCKIFFRAMMMRAQNVLKQFWRNGADIFMYQVWCNSCVIVLVKGWYHRNEHYLVAFVFCYNPNLSYLIIICAVAEKIFAR